MFQTIKECPRSGDLLFQPQRLRRTDQGETAAQAGSPATLPWCCLTEQDLRLLEEAARIHGGEDSAMQRALAHKIQNSVLELSEEKPAGYVRLNSRVTFRVNDQMTLSRVLVHWNTFLVPGRDLSLATPWGIALLGTRAGHTAAVYWRGGIAEVIGVEAVEDPVPPLPHRPARAPKPAAVAVAERVGTTPPSRGSGRGVDVDPVAVRTPDRSREPRSKLHISGGPGVRRPPLAP